jgi:methylmalonyl-CoA mutase N-terminal domain/subunit
MVGVNKYQVEEPKRLDTLYIDRSIEKRQIQKLNSLKARRNNTEVKAALRGIKEAAERKENMCEPILRAVKVYATLQEICDEMRAVYGIYQDAGNY